ncbi:MAG: tetratricopeptide repeat protein [Sphingobacteriia bacterium]
MSTPLDYLPAPDSPHYPLAQRVLKGDADAQYELGVLARTTGLVSLEVAAYWYRKAAEQGHTDAQVNLADIYEHGIGVAKDLKEAFHWYQRAAEQGSLHAQNHMGVLYEQGNELTQDYAQAAHWYERAAEQGSLHAQYNLGLLYEQGKGVPQDYTQAAHWYQTALSCGPPWTMFKGLIGTVSYRLGLLYEQGLGVEQDASRARELYLQAAERGAIDEAIERLRPFLKPPKALFRQAQGGDPKAQYKLAKWYYNGAVYDYEKAAHWCRQAADQDHKNAQHWLGALYALGHGIEQDPAQATYWYQRASDASDQGDPEALVNLAIQAFLAEDFPKAVQWYRLAAEKGHVEAQYILGNIYSASDGDEIVEPDYPQAVNWYLQAAEQGHPDAPYALGKLYEEGKGVAKDEAQAIHWYRQATDNYRAIERLRQLGV